MKFVDLPEEILIIIIRELDIKSVHNLYNTCKYIRNVVRMQGVIKICQMSMNAMATARSLKLNFFNDISKHLQELNMCGVPDLCKTSLLPVMKKLKSLKSLNVSYTNINILDFLQIHEMCPTIKNICINFRFAKTVPTIPQQILLQYQRLFKKFENIHFVGCVSDLFYSKLALSMLQMAKLNTLKFTITESKLTIFQDVDCEQVVQFNQFTLFLLNWKKTTAYYGRINDPHILSFLDLSKYEFLIIMTTEINVTHEVYVSPVFRNFFSTHFNVNSECITKFTDQSLWGNVAIMLWEKNATKFDDEFFCNITKQVKYFFPYYCSSPDCETSLLLSKYDWFYTSPEPPDVQTNNSNKCEPKFKKRRIAPPNFVLDYDALFAEKQRLQLSFLFNCQNKNPVTLSANCDYLQKLTFLSLSGIVHYSKDFFNILFRYCDQLVTLNVEASSLSPCAAPIARTIPLTDSLKNLRLVDKRIDFKSLFSSLSLCKTLENIYIFDESSDPGDLADPSLVFKRCDNLYNFFIHAPMTDTARNKKFNLLNKDKARCGKYHLNIDLHVQSTCCELGYDPYIEVFNLCPIKSI